MKCGNNCSDESVKSRRNRLLPVSKYKRRLKMIYKDALGRPDYGIEEPHQCWFGKLTEIKFSKVNPKYDLAYIELFNGLYKICLKSELIMLK